MSRRIPRFAALITLIALIAIAAPASASAAPEDVVAGSGKKWFSGSFGSVSGTNCSILGGSYSETMVNAYSGYGGAPSGGVVKVGDKFWATITIGVPGNLCPHGSDIIVTDLGLPPGVSYDATRQIRCFSTPRHSQAWYESTNENWDMRPIGINAYGRTCPTGPTAPWQGGIGFDARGLANGQMFQMFVPVVASQVLVGMGNNAHKFTWIVSPLGSYGSFQTTAWANVFSSSGPTSPYLYFAREPSVVPFWDSSAPATQENRVELFANLFSNFLPGTLCWDLYKGASTSSPLDLNCEALGGSWGSAVANTSDSWYLTGNGPNGGAVPFYFSYPTDYGQTFTIRYRFTYNGGASTIYSEPLTFKALAGPDEDGDGVPNDGTDQCPTQASTNAGGCPTSLASVDPDGDGLVGSKDKCPSLMMIGAADGCPTLTAKPGKLPTFKRGKLAKGVNFPVTCSLDTPASASFTVSNSVAKKLKLKVKKGAKSATIATAKGSCKAQGGGKLKLKLTSAAKKKVGKYKKSISGSLTVSFTPAGGVAPVSSSVKSVKLR